MTPEVLDGVVHVQTIRQPNGFPRTDLWVEARVAAKLKKGLYLMAKQRHVGTKFVYKFPLYKLRWLWRPNEQTSHWRLDAWKPWRDWYPTVRPPALELQKNLQGGIATLNINGMGATCPLVQNLLVESDIDILAIQETLLGKDSYRFYLNGYEVYTRPQKDGF